MTNKYALELARILPRLCGGIETIAEARKLATNSQANEILDYLENMYNIFAKAGFDNCLMFDLGMVQRINYYTGLVFRGYISGIGEAVLSGGRYDDLLQGFGSPLSACGFGLNLSAAAELSTTPLPYIKPLEFRNVDDVRKARELVEASFCKGDHKK